MTQPSNNKKPIIGITIGDINGIGIEVIIKTFSDARMCQMLTPVIYGSSKIISYYRKALKAEHFNYYQIKHLDQLNPGKVNVLNCWEENVSINVGSITSEGGKYAFLSLKAATDDLLQGSIDALVTAPINKKNIQQSDFAFPGHTEYLTQRSQSKDSLMLLIAQGFRVGVVTGHIPLKEVSGEITKEQLHGKIKLLEQSLKKDFQISKPRIAVLGLNPHAGDQGLLGSEEEEIIVPVIDQLKEKGKLIFGPYSADGFFGTGNYTQFDGILAMYHDQGLAPFKALAFDQGVNFTAGLPVIRTSPDHGTGYNLAGKGLADEGSFRASVFAALDIIKTRQSRLVPQDQ